ncbi:MAG: Lanosterol synthase (Oxidosqualene--lanosterol cyclase) [Stictis urceolatum]|nr:Lanosterol synthase (Oxidosqualene--lanosterol cyclase) [Stictis urceolata]
MVTTRRQNTASEKLSAGQDVLSASTVLVDKATDLERWRLKDDHGCQTWHYLETDEEVKAWPQTEADRHHLGLSLDLPTFLVPKDPLSATHNAIQHFAHFQLEPGNWACEYGGPMFLLPGIVIAWYVTGTPVAAPVSTEIKRYLFNRQHPEDGGWGLHIEGESSVFGTAMNYTVLRLLGADREDARMVKARGLLWHMQGAVMGPHWAKFWLSVLGVMEWDCVNPVPPELWLVPDWVPIAPWRWWIHMRQVFLPMSYIWSKKFSYEGDKITDELKEELYVQPYESVNFAGHRNSISDRDNYHPKSWLLNSVNWALVNIWNPFLRTSGIQKAAEDWTFDLIRREDENTLYANLAPVNAPMNMLACYIHDGPGSYSVRRHRERIPEFLWMKNEGMLANGTNGVQTWDTSFLIQAVHSAGLAEDPRYKPMLTKALEFLEDQQIRENVPEMEVCYRHNRKGAWAFSTKDQGYTVSDCTSEALKSVLLLQSTPGYPTLVSQKRARDAIDTLLTMQNPSGGFASYERQRGGEWMELLNAAEVFGRIMVEYDYPECTTAVLTALSLFQKLDPEYRAPEIQKTIQGAAKYVRNAQRPDGSWYGSWGICFTYAGMFALESLASVEETYENSERVRRACEFLVGKQRSDGGWGESYKSCETGVWVEHPEGSQVVQTCWAIIGLMETGVKGGEVEEAIRRGVKLVMGRQMADGGWAQEGIEGVFNKSCMISYPNYRYIFGIKALGMFAQLYGNPEIQ